MKRRELVTAGAALGCLSAVVPSLAIAQSVAMTEGKDFLALGKAVATDAPKGKVEVIEFFGYFCPHCNAFEPMLEQWVKKAPANVVFKRVPVAFDPRAQNMQKLYYALEIMGKVEAYHRQVFAAVHVKKMNLMTPEGVLEWAKGSGIDFNAFKQTFESFAINTKMTRANQLVNAFQVGGVPSFGVQGRYYTDGELTKSNVRSLQVVDYLIAEASKTA